MTVVTTGDMPHRIAETNAADSRSKNGTAVPAGLVNGEVHESCFARRLAWPLVLLLGRARRIPPASRRPPAAARHADAGAQSLLPGTVDSNSPVVWDLEDGQRAVRADVALGRAVGRRRAGGRSAGRPPRSRCCPIPATASGWRRWSPTMSRRGTASITTSGRRRAAGATIASCRASAPRCRPIAARRGRTSASCCRRGKARPPAIRTNRYVIGGVGD